MLYRKISGYLEEEDELPEEPYEEPEWEVI